MVNMLIVLLCVSVLIGQSRSQVFSEQEQASVIEKNNALRRQEAFEMGVKNMAERKWSPTLAAQAQKEAESCLMKAEHGSDFTIAYGFMKAPDRFNLIQDFWYSQKRLFNHSTNKCPNRTPYACSTYLNVVKNTGSLMGCGRNFCANIKKGKSNSYQKDTILLACLFKKHIVYKEATKTFVAPFSRSADTCLQCRDSVFNPISGLCRKERPITTSDSGGWTFTRK